MKEIQVVDAAELLREEIAGDVVVVLYDVLGWRVRVETSASGPTEAPERMEITRESGLTDGITTAVLRAIPLQDARRRLARMKQAAARRSGEGVPVMPERLVTSHDWATFAKAYADAVAEGQSKPLQNMARLTGISRNTLSARTRRAREMGLLTAPSRSSLGELTTKAQGILGGGE